MATMTAVWVLVRVRLRARWRALLGLALLVGVASGAVMAAAVGARRTDTAYSRLLESTRAEDVEVEIGGFDNSRFIDSLKRLPQVADMGLESVALLAPDMPGDPPRFSSSSSHLQGVMSVDGRVGWTVNRPLILAGRRPDPARPDEVGLSESLARRWRVGPGDTIRLRALSPEQLEHALVGERVIPAGLSLVLTVVAVQELPDDLGVNPGAAEGFVSLTPTFYRTHRDRIAHFAPTPRVRLVHGRADVAAFTAAVRRLSGDSAEVSVIARADLAQLVEQATRTQAVALVLFAALAAVAALVVIGQILTRELFLAATGDDTVRALGASRQQLFAATMLPVAMVSAFGALVGAGIAVLASPLMPVGLARRAEPSPGLAVHLAGIGVGIVLTLLLLGARAAVPAWRLARVRPREPVGTGRARATSTLADTAARAGLPASSVVGLRMALEQGRGSTAVPVRTTLVGVTAGIVALVAALTFGASLDRLLNTPRLYGWNFDAIAGDWTLEEPASRRPIWLAANSHVSAFSAAWFARVLIDGTEVYAAGIDTANGRVFPTIVEGHEPDGPDEIVLGTRTLRQLGRHLGQTVEVAAGRSVAVRIVGRFALLTGDEERSGTGAVLTLEGLQRLSPAQGSGYGVFYIRYAPGTDAPAALRSLQQPSAEPEQDVLVPRAPTDVENLGRVGGLPGVLAGLLALLAASALAHLLLTSIRRRGHDLAILKTLGFVRRQVSATVAWQATAVAMVAVVIGVPLGVALGRWTWSLLIDRIGLSAEPVTPGPTLLVGVLAAMLVANLVAVWPGRVAARTRPAVALRSE